MFQTIDTTDTNLPVNLFAPEGDTAEAGNSDWLALACCSYSFEPFRIDCIWEADDDE